MYFQKMQIIITVVILVNDRYQKNYKFNLISVDGPSPLVYQIENIYTRDDLCVREVEVSQGRKLAIKSAVSFHEVILSIILCEQGMNSS